MLETCGFEVDDDDEGIFEKIIRLTKRIITKTTDEVGCLITLMDSVNEAINVTFAQRPTAA